MHVEVLIILIKVYENLKIRICETIILHVTYTSIVTRHSG